MPMMKLHLDIDVIPTPALIEFEDENGVTVATAEYEELSETVCDDVDFESITHADALAIADKFAAVAERIRNHVMHRNSRLG